MYGGGTYGGKLYGGAPGAKPGITPTGIPSAQAFGTAHVVLKRQFVSPTGIVSAEQVVPPFVQIVRPHVTVTPTGIASAQAFGTATLTGGTATVHPVGIASSETFGIGGVGNPFIIPNPTGTRPLPLMLVRRSGIRH
jgi:hypothetical protein